MGHWNPEKHGLSITTANTRFLSDTPGTILAHVTHMETIQEMQKAVEIDLEVQRLRLRKRGHATLTEAVDKPAWTPTQDFEFRDWLDVETAELPSRHAHAVREHLFGTLRKADVEGLGISRTHFNALRTKLAEKWMRVSR